MILENMVSENHTFVRSIIRDNNKTPCIALYSDEQISDLKNICCTGHSILGVDKTFNLCEMHVTVTCYNDSATLTENSSNIYFYLFSIFRSQTEQNRKHTGQL